VSESGLILLAGGDELLLPFLELGAKGGILVYTHIVGPRVRELVTRFGDGDAEGAREIEKELAPIIEALSVANPIPVKAALNMLGHEVGGHRLPLVEATEGEKTALRGALERAGILAGARA
jgi:4-hydroxy-tetrahydrodipicolinate synthase